MLPDHGLAVRRREAREVAWVERAQAGDQDMLLLLLEHYRPLLRRIARGYFLPYGDTEDLLQEATLGFIKAVRDFEPARGIPFRPFAELCVTRQIITAVKTATRQKHLPLNTAISLSQPRFDEGDQTLADVLPDRWAESPEDRLERLEEASALGAAVRDVLSPYERAVAVRYLEGMSFQQIADACGTHVKSVDNALWRVKCKLRRHLAREGEQMDDARRA